MPDKAATLACVVRSNTIVDCWLKILILGVFLAILIIWQSDGLNMNTFYKGFDNRKLNNSVILSKPHQDLIKAFTNLTCKQPHLDNSGLNTTQQQLSESPVIPKIDVAMPWISSEFEANYSSNLLVRWLTPGGEPCKDSTTVGITIPRLDGNKNIELSTGDIHEFVFQALDDSGKPHCLGGDYFETDLSGEKWKARPPVKDLGNGTYTFSLQVHPDYAGDYNLTMIHLFRRFEGLKLLPERFAVDRVLRVIPIRFLKSASRLSEIRRCEKFDYTKDVWLGRWTRHARNDSCEISDDGRYRCQEPSFHCQQPWCNGPLGSLESNGWVYSAHCSFKLYSSEEAWNCLNKHWIFWWGDSNHCDTIRNMLNFILDVRDVKYVDRIYDANITNPRNPFQVVRFTSIFNGHPNYTENYEGLNSLANEGYRGVLKGYFSQDEVPDTIIMNSGLHDGFHWSNITHFIKGADYAAAFWAEVVGGVRRRGVLPPRVIYRTTVATGGYARKRGYNPHKMEAFNGVVLERLRRYGLLDGIIDDFDMTYPWHYDNRCNDGAHYGRPPRKMKWRDGEIGHQYFVDLMLCHVLLNVLCVA